MRRFDPRPGNDRRLDRVLDDSQTRVSHDANLHDAETSMTFFPSVAPRAMAKLIRSDRKIQQLNHASGQECDNRTLRRRGLQIQNGSKSPVAAFPCDARKSIGRGAVTVRVKCGDTAIGARSAQLERERLPIQQVHVAFAVAEIDPADVLPMTDLALARPRLSILRTISVGVGRSERIRLALER